MIYDNVKKLCIDNNISLHALEIRVGLSNGTINGWKRKYPSLRSLEKISKYFGVPVSTLVEEREDEEAG